MSNPNLEDLDPESPEYDAALEAAQNAEEEAALTAAAANRGEGDENDDDEGDEGDEGEGAKPAATTEAAAADAAAAEAAATAAAEAEAAAAATAAATPKVAGVLGKDGKTVLPYAALHASRNASKQHRLRAEEAERQLAERDRQIEDLKAGRKPDPTAADMEGLTAAELQELATDFPAMAKVVKVAQAALTRVAELEKKATPAEEQANQEEESDPVQDALDLNPVLVGWMSTEEGAPMFQRAQVLDRALEGSPKWKDKPMAERFAHVAGLVADEFDIQLEEGAVYATTAPAPRQQTTATPSPPDPKAALLKAQRAEPNTLSDFKGGAVDQTEQRLERMPAQRQLSRMMDMSDADIDAHLARLG